jgi:phosphate transport system substrate-binding protein
MGSTRLQAAVNRNNRWAKLSVMAVACLPMLSTVSFAEHEKANYTAPFVDPALSAYSAKKAVDGRMTIAGSDTMQPVLSKLALEFRRRHPDMKIAVQGSRDSKLTPEQVFVNGIGTMRRGDGDPSGHFGAYDVQILASSRALTETEIQRFVSRYGYAPLAIPIAQDGLAIYVHRDSPIERLTLGEVDAMFSTSRRRGLPDMQSWGQVGLDGSWEQAPIRLYGRDQRSTGTLPFFKHVVLRDGDFKKTILAQPGSASVVEAVGRDLHGIGYSGIGFQTSLVRPVALAEKDGMPYVLPTTDTVRSGEYPLSRPLYLYVNKNPQKDLDPKISEFLRFVNSREGQETVARAGVYPLNATQVASNLALLQAEPLQAAAR